MIVTINIDGVEENYRIIDADDGAGNMKTTFAWPVGADGQLPKSQIGAIDLTKYANSHDRERRDKIDAQIRRSS